MTFTPKSNLTIQTDHNLLTYKFQQRNPICYNSLQGTASNEYQSSISNSSTRDMNLGQEAERKAGTQS